MKIQATKQITQKTLLFALTAILILSAIAQVSAQGNPAALIKRRKKMNINYKSKVISVRL
jgi:hypothetical protein